MDQHRDQDRNKKGRDHRPHHISNIAHHFFDDVPEGMDLGSGNGRGPICISVACAQANAMAAEVCAHLALAASSLHRDNSTDPVYISESPWVPWSALSQLPTGVFEELASADSPVGWPVTRPGQEQIWRVGEAVDLEDIDGGASLMLQNLGSLKSSQLDKLEALGMAEGWPWHSLPRVRGLVWCLGASQAHTLTSAHLLGRAIAWLQPEHLEIIVLKELGPEDGVSADGDLHYPHLKAVCQSLPVHITPMPRVTTGPTGEVNPVLVPLINRILHCNSD